MEHEVSKNIPVIMMSAHDSVSTVYKCMLKGAADFLVKPVRKNELKNMWQHVWRRQSSMSVGNGHQEENDLQQKVEATAENNATSNRSSGYMDCIKRNRECIEKGSDAQSSCTKPDMEPEGPPMEQLKDTMDYQLTTQPIEAEDNVIKVDTIGQEKNAGIDFRWENVNVIVDADNTSREAIDLIGSFDSYPKASYKSSLNYGTTKVDHPSPMLDLSLRRCHPSSSVNQFSDDRHRVKHSDVSAFSRYINKTQPPLTSGSASICNQQKECETNSERPVSKNPVEYISDTHSAPVGSQSQSQFPSPKERVFPVPVPVRGYGSALPPPFCVQPGLAQMQSPCSSDMHNTTEAIEDHSGSSNFCNGGTLARLNSIGSGSNVNNSHRSTQREAALNKFRMKRKDRCFDKKVRYESRKKLAEQRPRVKGQFVRQGQTSNSSPMEVDAELATTKTIA
ncbi:CCT domain, CheY-like superfamily [Artemisia annua]|nr:CCT domain, CheY-like superfamily [Artemisia annua]